MRDPRGTVRRLGTLLMISAFVIGTSVPASSHDSLARYTDPKGDGQVDVWRSSRAKIHITRTYHRQRFQVYGYLGPDWDVEVFVDSRGGPRADFKLWAFEDLGHSGCGGRQLFGARIALRCGRKAFGVSAEGRLWWGMRRSVLRPTKPIRWRIVTRYPGADPYPGPPADKAPDTGWFV